MKFFIDTANIGQIERIAGLGVLDGVTTNPTLMAKEGIRGDSAVHAHYRKICELADADVSAEVIGTTFDDMMREAQTLAALDPRIVVKIPMLPAGVRALHILREKGIRTNCTLVFSAAQALLAARAGVNYISPFIGRFDDIGEPGAELIRRLTWIFGHYSFDSEVLAASIRSPLHVVQCAEAGADVVTCPFAVFEAMFRHPLTDAGLEKFLKDHHASQ
ncbi:MAG: fructose-6-phosphate aldolase [Gammaproteobacteria bacterium]|nr:fructose-6-phosphate aldolase [Gammaproteobacteria bacterium]